ncbi:MAG: hypothetical protein FWD56_06260 [Bacteroidales bacterium]|nr:hypothetical protein [Bacteroidales bacterium]
MKKNLALTVVIMMLAAAFTACSPDMDLPGELAHLFDGGNGLAEATAYRISTPEQLANLAELVNNGADQNNVFFKLTKNIDMSTYVIGTRSGGVVTNWIPIGKVDKPFSGTFDGAGYIISNIQINMDAIYVGLFGFVDGTNAVVKDVHISSGDIIGKGWTGAICGFMRKGTISGCSNNANVTATGSSDSYVGGVIGLSWHGNVIDCHNTGDVTANINNFVGGVAGACGGALFGCSNTGTVMATCSTVGGVVGCNVNGTTVADTFFGTVIACFNTGDVTGTAYVGGVAGGNEGDLFSCYNTGKIVGTDYIGGVTGVNINNANANGDVSACYNTGVVEGDNAVGGVVGHNMGIVTACYWMQSTAVDGIGTIASTGTTSFVTNFTPSGSPAWGTGTGQINGWWKPGTTDGTQLPKIYWE